MLFKKFIKLFFLLLILLTAFLITTAGFRHFYPLYGVSSFMQGKQPFFTVYLPAVYGHVLTGGFLMFIGLLGFSDFIRNNYIGFHRLTGKIYVGLILFVSAPCAFVMAVFADGGAPVKICFVLLTVFWWLFTWRAYFYVKKGNLTEHKQFMLRSYSLLLSAICLRLYSFFWVLSGGTKGPEVYVYLAWFSWVPNLIFTEIYLYINNKKKPHNIY